MNFVFYTISHDKIVLETFRRYKKFNYSIQMYNILTSASVLKWVIIRFIRDAPKNTKNIISL